MATIKQETDNGYTLLELVVAVSILLIIMGVGGAILYGKFTTNQLNRSLDAVAAQGYAEALDADTGFDETKTAATVLAVLEADLQEQSMFEGVELRHTGEGWEDLCVFATHPDTDHEAWNGGCGREWGVHDYDDIDEIDWRVANPSCTDNTTDNSLNERQFRVEWGVPEDLMQDADLVYYVQVNDLGNGGESSEFTTTEREYVHEVPRKSTETVYPHLPSTEVWISVMRDDTSQQPVAVYADSANTAPEAPNTRVCSDIFR